MSPCLHPPTDCRRELGDVTASAAILRFDWIALPDDIDGLSM
jgi:hypothetical protein